MKNHFIPKQNQENEIDMITVIGTGHVFNLSDALLEIFDEKSPDILCVELDNQRFQGLMLKQQDPEKYKKQAKNQPMIYKMLSRFQDSMADEYGVIAGQEMLTAINYAQSHQKPIGFIDMNARVMFSRMLKEMTITEKIKLIFSGFGGFFVSKKRVEKELDKIQDNFDYYMTEIGKKFPTIKRVLIDERNMYMKNRLKNASEEFEKVVAVVGDGHIPGLTKLLDKEEIEYETIRLNELLNNKTGPKNTSSASFSIENEQL